MNKNEIKSHLDTLIGTDSDKLNAMGFLIALCAVWSSVSRPVKFVFGILRINRAWRLGGQALIMLLDNNCNKQKSDDNG